MLPTSATAEPVMFTGPEPLSREKITGLFSKLFRIRAEGRLPAGEASAETGVEGDERREKLSELTVEWREQEIHMLIDSLSATHDMNFMEAIKARLLSLREMLQEEEGPSVELSLDSLRTFLAFLRQVPGVRQPSITLTPEGEVYARWKDEGARLFATHFISGETVRFVAFRPNPRRPRLVQRISGVDAVDTVMSTANNVCSVLDWVLE